MDIEIPISALIIVIITFFVLRKIGINLYLHPLGKKSVRLIHDETVFPPVNEALNWRIKMIDDAERKGEKVLYAEVGEFGKGMLETVEYALDKGFNVKIIGNKTYCNSREKVVSLLSNPKYSGRFKFSVLDQRPQDHFALIGKSNIFIEDPHEWNAKLKKSLGIVNAHKHISNYFYMKFENANKIARDADITFIKKMSCYT